jgi:hypothetical protein
LRSTDPSLHSPSYRTLCGSGAGTRASNEDTVAQAPVVLPGSYPPVSLGWTENFTGDGDTLLKTTDGGHTWKPVTEEIVALREAPTHRRGAATRGGMTPVCRGRSGSASEQRFAVWGSGLRSAGLDHRARVAATGTPPRAIGKSRPRDGTVLTSPRPQDRMPPRAPATCWVG